MKDGCVGENPFDAWKQIWKSAWLSSRLGRLALEEVVGKFVGIAVSAMEEDDGVGVFARLSLGDDLHVDGGSSSS